MKTVYQITQEYNEDKKKTKMTPMYHFKVGDKVTYKPSAVKTFGEEVTGTIEFIENDIVTINTGNRMSTINEYYIMHI